MPNVLIWDLETVPGLRRLMVVPWTRIPVPQQFGGRDEK